MFERTWEVAVKLCQKGRVDGRHFSVGVGQFGAPDGRSDAEKKPRFAVLSPDGKPIFAAPSEEEAEAGALFTVARRFVELEDAHQRGTTVPEYTQEARRTFRDSLREWGLMDEGTRRRWCAVMAPVAEQLAPLQHHAELLLEIDVVRRSCDEAYSRVSNIESALRKAQIACSDAAAVSRVPEPLVQALEVLRAALREGLG